MDDGHRLCGPDDGSPVDDMFPTDSELPYYDLESERLDFDYNAVFNTTTATSCSDTDSSVYDCCLDESFRQIKTDLDLLQSPKETTAVSSRCGGTQPASADDDDQDEDDFPEFSINERFDVMKNRIRNYRQRETETLRRHIIELNETLAQVTDGEGMVKKCERLELGISKQEKIQLLKTDIAAIKSRLVSFSRTDRLDSNVQNKNQLQALLHTAKTELSNLDTYWNGRNIVSISEELNRHLNDSTTVLNHMNKEVADLYSIYANARQRLESEISRYQNALITLVECDKQLMELEMKFKGFGDDGVMGGNQKSGCFGSISDSGMSDSGSEHELNEQEKRLVNLKQLANNLMTIMTPGSEALTSIMARIENNEKQLKELQQTCKDLIGKTEIHTDEDQCDDSENVVDTNIVDAAAAEEDAKTPLKKTKDTTALLWRTLRIAVPFYLAVVILCSVGWLEPQCCDLQNNYKWSFALGLRYMNGPPPT